jgi:hypothetical protein
MLLCKNMRRWLIVIAVSAVAIFWGSKSFRVLDGNRSPSPSKTTQAFFPETADTSPKQGTPQGGREMKSASAEVVTDPPDPENQIETVPQLEPNRDRLRQLEDLAWNGPKPPTYPTYDSELLSMARADRPDQGFRGNTKAFKSGRYDVLVDTLDRKQRLLFKAELKNRDGDLRLGLVPAKIEYLNENNRVEAYDYSNFRSPFEDQESLGSSLNFPFDSFWRRLVSRAHTKCASVLVALSGWTIPRDSEFLVSSFRARAYCRLSFEDARPVGQMAFCHEDGC